MTKEIINDDVVIMENLNTRIGEYNIERYYIGGINEAGEEDLYSACGCHITISETSNCKDDHTAINDLLKYFLFLGYDAEAYDDVIMNTAPEIKKSLTIANYDSEDVTKDIVKMIKNYFV